MVQESYWTSSNMEWIAFHSRLVASVNHPSIVPVIMSQIRPYCKIWQHGCWDCAILEESFKCCTLKVESFNNVTLLTPYEFLKVLRPWERRACLVSICFCLPLSSAHWSFTKGISSLVEKFNRIYSESGFLVSNQGWRRIQFCNVVCGWFILGVPTFLCECSNLKAISILISWVICNIDINICPFPSILIVLITPFWWEAFTGCKSSKAALFVHLDTKMFLLV